MFIFASNNFLSQITYLFLTIMQLTLRYFLFALCFFAFQNIKAQTTSHWLKAGTNAPYQYSLQYEINWSEKVYLSVESGIFAKTYQPILFRALENKTQGSLAGALVKSTFQSLQFHSVHAGWQFGAIQVGVFGQQGILKGDGKPTDLIGTYYDVHPESLPHLNFTAKTYQLGMSLGYRMPISKRLELHTSVGLSRIMNAQTSLTATINGSNAAGIVQILGEQMRQAIISSDYVPSLNIHIAYKLADIKHRKDNHKKLYSVLAKRR